MFGVSTETFHLGLQTPHLLFELEYPFDTGDVEAAVINAAILTKAS